MSRKRTENENPIPPDLVTSSGPTGVVSGDDWDRLFGGDEDTESFAYEYTEEDDDQAAPVSTRYLGFRLGQEHFAVPILNLSEVVRYQEITAVPRVRPFLRGIISVRGTIVPIVDLRMRLAQGSDARERTLVAGAGATASAGGDGSGPGVPQARVRPGSSARRVLITRHDEDVFGLLVDEVSDVFVAEEGEVEPPPATLPKRLLEVVTGIARVEGRIHTVLDVPAVLRFSAVAPGPGDVQEGH